MKIVSIKPLLINKYLFVEIETDSGLKGVGESGTWGFLEASATAVDRFATYLQGKDPLTIEHHWQYMYRTQHFRGAAIMGALSAIDIALWDIKGQHFGVPVYELLGGKTRDRARVYYHTRGETVEEVTRLCLEAKAQGFTAVGHLSPFLDEPRSKPYRETHAQMISRAIERIRIYREALGDEVDLCVEIHRKLSPADAIVLAQGIAQFHPMFYEDPVAPDNFDSMEWVAEHIDIPIATGERLHTLQEFAMLIKRRAVHFVRPDVCLCGGITGAKKIAALAEAFGIGVVPHNPLSPVSTAACVQLAACIPNFTIQELPSMEDKPPKSEVVHSDVKYDGRGYLIIPETPGIGAALIGDSTRFPFEPRPIVARLHIDGSVVDD